jgi:hypothetical protein
MVHLAVHLPEEALLRGPVQYGWMFPVERRLLTCKHYVRNIARPEGSIAEAYVVDECLTFFSRYFDDLETRINWPGRNRERDDSHVGDVSVFNHRVHFLGGYTRRDHNAGMKYVFLHICSIQADRIIEKRTYKDEITLNVIIKQRCMS